MGGWDGPSWAPVPQLRTACPPQGQHPLTLDIGHPGSVYFGHWASCAVAFGHLGFHAPWALGTLGTRQTGGQSAWHWVPRASRAFGHRAPWASCTSVLRALGVVCPKIPAPWGFGTPASGTLGIVCPKIPAPWALGTLGTVCRGICAHCALGDLIIVCPGHQAYQTSHSLSFMHPGHGKPWAPSPWASCALCHAPWALHTMGTAHHGQWASRAPSALGLVFPQCCSPHTLCGWHWDTWGPLSGGVGSLAVLWVGAGGH